MYEYKGRFTNLSLVASDSRGQVLKTKTMLNPAVHSVYSWLSPLRIAIYVVVLVYLGWDQHVIILSGQAVGSWVCRLQSVIL